MRKIVSLFLFESLLLTLITGIVLYLMPPGRIAYWTDWRLFFLDKDQWEAIHIVFGLILCLAGIWHTILNWTVLKRYLGQLKRPERAFILTLFFSLLLLVAAIKNLPPVSFIMDLQSKLKNSWPKPEVPPPLPHAELLPLSELMKREGIPLPEVISRLKKHGYKIPSAKLSLKELARLNHTSPAKIYQIITKNRQTSHIIPSRLGEYTLEDLCKFYQLETKSCESILRKHGLKPVWKKELKEWIFQKGYTPKQIAEWLSNHKD